MRSKRASQFKVLLQYRKIGFALPKLVAIFVYFFLYAPIVMLILTSFDQNEVMTFPFYDYSTKWYSVFFEDAEMHKALLNSAIVGISSALIAGIAGTLCALGLVRENFRGKRFLNLLVLTPMIIPPVITGMTLVILLHIFGLQRGFSYLIIGHSLIGLPYVVVVVAAQLYGFPRDIEQAALTMGANEIETFFEITLPLLMPSVLAGIMFAFVTSLQEYPATQAWVSPISQTLPILIYDKIRDRLTPEINVVGVFMICVAVIIPLLAEYMRRKTPQIRSEKI